jgi:hypothetical protein
MGNPLRLPTDPTEPFAEPELFFYEESLYNQSLLKERNNLWIKCLKFFDNFQKNYE